jgi:hypothetical protein
MSPLEALWDSWMRAIDQLPPQLRAWARIQLGNLALQGAAAGLLLLFLLGGAVAAKAAAAALSLLGAGSAALLVLGLAKVAEAIGSKSSAALDEAVSFFARWAREAQTSISPDALAQKVGELTGKLESIPVFGKYVQLLDTVGANAISDAIFRGELVKLNAIADRLAAIEDLSARRALQQAISSTPGAGDAIVQAGPDAIDSLNGWVSQYGTTPEVLAKLISKPGLSVAELERMLNLPYSNPDLLLEYFNQGKSIQQIENSLPLGRGSTADLSKGSTLPRDLREQYAIEAVIQHPKAGTALPLPMNDPRWSKADGWVKMQQIIQSGGLPINVHYVRNTITDQIDDFKIIIPGPRP